MTTSFKGFIAAVFTPMKVDGSLDLDPIARLVNHYVETGIAGLYVTGSTGEGTSLTVDERCRTVEAYIRAANDRLPVIAHVGHNSLRESYLLAEFAKRAGITAISAAPPTYFKPATLNDLIECMKEITAGAPEIPFYYYHIPSKTGVNFDMVEFLRQGSAQLPSLAGLKFTSPMMHELQACIDLDKGRFEIFSGMDEMFLSGLAHGVRGAVGSTYNFAAGVYHRILEAFENGNMEEARLWQARSIAFIQIILRSRPLSAQKAIMKLVGLDCGPPRLPNVPLDEAEVRAMNQQLESIGFFEWRDG